MDYKLIFIISSTILFIVLCCFYFYSVFKKKPDLTSVINEKSIIEERMFIENLVNQRFNFLMILFGLILATSYQIDNPLYLDMILIISFFVLSSLSITIFRAQVKLDYSLDWIFKNILDHAATQIHENVKGISVRKLIGYHLPFIFSVICYIILILSLYTSILPFNTIG